MIRWILVFMSFQGLAQTSNCERVLFHGKVVDTLFNPGFYNLMVINKTTGKGVFGQPNGSFSIYCNSGDSIVFSTREYETRSWTVVPDSNCQQKIELAIARIPQKVQEVVVYPIKSLQQIREEREALALRETRMVTGIDVIQSPITALYQAFSKKERSKRWIAEQEYKDNQRKIVKELLRTYVAADIFELSEEGFDGFMDFLNLNPEFLKTASEMELITFIKDKFEHYRAIYPER